MSVEERFVNVVVVGYGPTGLALSSLLARLGHRVAVVERWDELYGRPRAVGFGAEALRIVQAAGDIDVALEDAVTMTRLPYANGSGEVLVELDWGGDDPCGFPTNTSVYQPNIERAIDLVARERGVEVLQGWQATGFEEHEGSVTLTARRRDGGDETLQVTGSWLVAADGGESVIRTLAGIELEQLGSTGALVSIDARWSAPVPERFQEPAVTCAPPRMHVVMPMGRARMRVEHQLLEGEDREAALAPEAVLQHLEEWYGLGPDDVELERQRIYEFDTALAVSWSAGRVVLAGDAAHRMSPFLGQGAASGFRDAIALAWRLDLILRGVAGSGLLTSYEAERAPQVRAIATLSAELGGVAFERDPDVAAARDAALRAGGGEPPPPPPPLAVGFLRLTGDERARGLVGTLAPQGHLERDGVEGRADDVVGWGFTLIADGHAGLEGLEDSHRSALAALGAHVAIVTPDVADGTARDVDGTYGALFAAHDVTAVFVRPDFYVFGTAASPTELADVIDEATRQLASSG